MKTTLEVDEILQLSEQALGDGNHNLLAVIGLFVIAEVEDLLHKASSAPPGTEVM